MIREAYKSNIQKLVSSFKPTVVNRLENFCKQIDQKYKGLGIPTLFGTLSVMCGKSVVYVGAMGTGKTTTIDLTPTPQNTLLSSWDSFTLNELSTKVGTAHNKSLFWKFPEWNSLSEYHRKNFMRIIPSIISSGKYEHKTTFGNKPTAFYVDIKNCQLTVAMAIQPLQLERLMIKCPEYKAMAQDRFVKFLMVNPLRIKGLVVRSSPIAPTLHNYAPIQNITFPISMIGTTWYNDVEELFAPQISKGRSHNFTQSYLKALSSFIGEKRVQIQTVKLFHTLFSTYLELFNKLLYRKTMGSPLEIPTGKLRVVSYIAELTNPTVYDIMRAFSVSRSSVVHEVNEPKGRNLKDLGLVETVQIKRKTVYRLAQKYIDFFNDYRANTLFP